MKNRRGGELRRQRAGEGEEPYLATGGIASRVHEPNRQQILVRPVNKAKWRKYTALLMPILEQIDDQADMDCCESLWQQTTDEAVRCRETEALASALLHLLEAKPFDLATDWLFEKLRLNLDAEAKQNPMSAKPWKNLARSHLIMARLPTESLRADQHWEEAAKALTRALELAPNDKVSRQRLEFVNQHQESVAEKDSAIRQQK